MRARIAGTELSYDVRGEGPALLFLHAFPLSLGMWDAQAAALAETCRVLRFDARGFGASAPTDGILTMERIADDAAALLDHLGISRAVVCGCSMGGYAAFALVRRHAERLRGLVLANTRAGADTPEARAKRSLLSEQVRARGVEAAVEAFLPGLLGRTTHAERPEVVTRVREAVLAAAPGAICAALAGLAARADSSDTLREVRVPALLLGGEEDTLTPPTEARALHAALSGSRLEVVPAAGHLAAIENPDAFNRALGEFLSTLN